MTNKSPMTPKYKKNKLANFTTFTVKKLKFPSPTKKINQRLINICKKNINYTLLSTYLKQIIKKIKS